MRGTVAVSLEVSDIDFLMTFDWYSLIRSLGPDILHSPMHSLLNRHPIRRSVPADGRMTHTTLRLNQDTITTLYDWVGQPLCRPQPISAWFLMLTTRCRAFG